MQRRRLDLVLCGGGASAGHDGCNDLAKEKTDRFELKVLGFPLKRAVPPCRSRSMKRNEAPGPGYLRMVRVTLTRATIPAFPPDLGDQALEALPVRADSATWAVAVLLR